MWKNLLTLGILGLRPMLDNSYTNLSSLPPRKSRSHSRSNDENRWDRQFEILKGYKWFHGFLSRGEAEKTVTENGSFLVRASNSSNGFVVTTRWNGRHSHVVIFPTTDQSNDKFHFDELYDFDNIHELIHFYKDSQMPIASDCGAILFTPVAAQVVGEKEKRGSRYRQRSRGNSASRSKPVSKAKARLKKFGSEPLLMSESEVRSRRSSNASVVSNGASSERIADDASTPPRYPPRTSSLSCMTVGNSADRDQTRPRRVSDVGGSMKQNHSSSQQNGVGSHNGSVEVKKSGSDSHLLESVTRHKPIRPLPRHSPEVSQRSRPNVVIRNPAQFYDDGGGDYTDYAQVRAISSNTRQALTIQTGDYITMEDSRPNPGSANLPTTLRTERYSSSHKSQSSFQSSDESGVYVLTSSSTLSSPLSVERCRDSYVDNYSSFPSPDPMFDSQLWNMWLSTGPIMSVPPDSKHLPAFTKPLDPAVWTTVLRLLADTNEDTLAGYIVNESCRLLHRFPSTSKIPSLENGFQLMLVPKAERYREQLINRSYCLSRFVAASILMCKPHERTSILKKWISVADSLEVVYRDFYSLHAVCDGVFSNQVRQIINPFSLLPQSSTLATTVCREARISHYQGDDCCVTPHVDISIPDVSHFIHVYSASYDDLKAKTPDSLWELISAARSWANTMPNDFYSQQSSTERRLWISELKPDVSVPILAELFATEVQMKLLWGSKGYVCPANERHQKFEVILNALAKRAVSNPGHVSSKVLI